MKKLVVLLILFHLSNCFGQLKEEKEGYYLEDQLYLKVAYNAFRDLPKSINQSGFSNSISFGFIRDIPFNKQRNFGIGAGIGYGFQTYFHNMKVYQVDHQTFFEYFESEENYDRNRLKIHQLEIPIEIRWRTSTIEKYKFWRIYSGLKINYIFANKSIFDLNGKQEFKNLQAINKLQYGLTLAAGYGTFNFFVYYGLTPLFKDAYLNDEKITLKELKFGLQFYLL